MPATATPNGLPPAERLAPPLTALSTSSGEILFPYNAGPTLTGTTTLSKTRVRASDFLAEDDISTESGVRPGLLKGSTANCAGNASGSGEFRIFDPNGNALSTSAYGWTRLFQGREYIPMLDAYDFRARTLWPELGRFGQEDPAGTLDSTNRYQALGGRWNGVTDALGRYQSDFHHGLTEYLARLAGFSMADATRIGIGAENPDQDEREPVTNGACVGSGGCGGEFGTANDSAWRLRRWHFPLSETQPGPFGGSAGRYRGKYYEVIPGSPEASEIVDDGIAKGDLSRFAEGLHAYQDSWSHQKVGSIEYKSDSVYSQYGHPNPRGGFSKADTDETFRFPEVAYSAAKATFGKMLDFRALNSSMTSAEIIKLWNGFVNAEGEIIQFFNYRTKNGKLYWLRQRGIVLNDAEIKDMSLPWIGRR